MSELRAFKRFTVTQGTRALAFNKIAEVIDISNGGISLLFLDEYRSSNLVGELSLDLLCRAQGLDARQIPGQIVWHKDISFSAIAGMIHKQVGVQFGNLSAAQLRSLQGLVHPRSPMTQETT